ncbi:hypothetical protein SLEP1_g14469 [Rubroshorea leprosula]|uniref:PGG domain-containing protein n=1 Tax=Rubroshorea leprosula TaxID=152421 RepID=A0AAV5IPZ6_9ROSI|nr:hypothetical protein SLEP1_g14469 [Rubroshorea leprosula]
MGSYETLYEAVRNGHIDQVEEMIGRNPAILDEAYMETTANACLLHAAVLAGRVQSVKVIIDHKEDWIEKFNNDGLGAIHMASEKGSAEIVRELLDKKSGQSQLRSTDGRKALHFAVLSESEGVLGELTSRMQRDRFISYLKDDNEPILHYALRKNRVRSFMHLLKLLKEKNLNDEDIRSFLNVKDDDGDTVLHIATARRQIEVLKLLLPQNESRRSINLYQVDMNAPNNARNTVLDVLYNSQANVENISNKIGRMLQEVGALRSQDTPQVASSQGSSAQSCWDLIIQASSDRFKCRFWDSLVTQQIKASDPSQKEALMVVAVLIATITYQAVLSPPGGFKQPEGQGNLIANQVIQEDQQHFNGNVVIASDTIMFAFITIFGSIGFFSSVLIIAILTSGFPLKLLLWLSLGALVADFIASLLYIAPIGFNIVCGTVVILAAFLVTQLFWIINPVAWKSLKLLTTKTEHTSMQPVRAMA